MNIVKIDMPNYRMEISIFMIIFNKQEIEKVNNVVQIE